MSAVSALRLRAVNDAPVRSDGDYVLYWMIASRRTRYNAALDRALDRAEELGKGLMVLEALRCDYPWASDRHHRFVLDGMRANREGFDGHPVRYFPYVEEEKGTGKGLLAALARRACVVVTDDWPNFFLPRMVEAAGRKLDVLLEAVDGCGLLPLRAADRVHRTAQSFRRHLQQTLPDGLDDRARPQPFRARTLPRPPAVPAAVLQRWPEAPVALLEGRPEALARLPLDHGVGPVDLRGGEVEGRKRLRGFLQDRLGSYAEERNHPDLDATSGLSPYLHYGHVATQEILDRITHEADWSPDDLAPRAQGQRSGWWGLSEGAEAFLDQVVTWRELGLNFQAHAGGAERYETLPEWARDTLAEHAGDAREHTYALETLEGARTEDPVWNASQRQLVREGVIHNYLRMLWGKRVLAWTSRPEEAWAALVHLNDRWALDGRDPNSYSGIGWCFGRYDRPWGPKRPVFGTIRYMTSKSARSKLRMGRWLEAHGPEAQGDLLPDV